MASPQRNAAIDDARQLLANCMFFRGLVENERDAVVARGRLRRFAAGETIFLMGAPAGSMMAVLTVQVRLRVPSPEGPEEVLALRPTGDVFVDIVLLAGKERPA